MPCYYPRSFKTAEYPVPCNRCAACLKTRISNWSVRLMQEDKVSTSAYFLTLTYDTTTVPISPNGFMSLCKRDLQLFFKRLRKSHPAGHTIKYYAAGEYGETRSRPHYHIILFNSDLRLQYSVSDHSLLYHTSLDGKVHVLHLNWPHGVSSVGLVSGASIGYTLKYINKKYFKPKLQNDDRQKEFALMSKGLGKSYLSQSAHQWHHSEYTDKGYMPLENGKKASLPRYYKDRLFTKRQISSIGDVHRERIKTKLDSVSDILNYSRNLDEAIKAQTRLHKLEIQQNDQF